MKKHRYLLGVDPGIISGISIYDREIKKLIVVTSCTLHELFDIIRLRKNEDIEVFIENPNTWIGFGNKKASDSKLQGAGAVKQTYRHIIEFLNDNDIPFTPTKLQGTLKKVTHEYFVKLTAWDGKSNSHGRDAALMVFNK